MASLIERLRSGNETRYTLDDLAQWISVAGGGGFWSFGGKTSMQGSKAEDITSDFVGLVNQVNNRSGVVSAAVFARALLLSQVRFVLRDGTKKVVPADIALNRPNRSTTRPELLMKAEYHASYAGNAYFARSRDGIRLLRPDWVSIILGSQALPSDPLWASDAEVVGYVYTPGGPNSKEPAESFLPENVGHWAPEPDPVAHFRGQSWIHSVIREVTTDGQAQDHRSKFFEHAATPQIIFALNENLSTAQVTEFAQAFKEGHEGVANAYKNLFVGGGADPKVVGSNFQQLDFNATQGRDETRIAMRSRVPAVVLGLKEAMQGSSLNAGNYSQTRRLWADAWFSPTVQGLCATLDKLVAKPSGTELWYDPDEVLFLQEDQKDAAEIAQTTAGAIRALIDGGWEPDAAADAVATGDFSKLAGNHTGLFSVQLRPPGTGEEG